MDDVLQNTNCVTTECGHCFHASCLMKNVAHNGFGCPYCRAIMAEEPEDDDSSEWSDVTNGEEEMAADYALRGLRFFTNNVEGEEHDEDDVQEEEEDIAEENLDNAEETPAIVKPSPAFITQKLIEQGVTMEQLVKAMLKDHDEYDAEEDAFLEIDDKLFGKFRIIISNYEPVVEVAQPVVEVAQPVVAELDDSAEPKRYANVTVRRQRQAI